MTEPTTAERKAQGKAARTKAPLESHADIGPDAGRDPVGLIVDQAATRVPELVPIRHGRMLVSPFTFYRGAALPMAADLSRVPSSGLRVQLCGDAHLSNFGAEPAEVPGPEPRRSRESVGGSSSGREKPRALVCGRSFARGLDRSLRLAWVTDRLLRFWPFVLAGAAWCWLVFLLPPGPYWLDSSELSAAAAGLGLAHETGFPLYCVVAHVATWLPFGEIAFRVHLLSATVAAVALFFVARLFCEFEGEARARLFAATISVALLSGILLFARHATTAEVYAPSVLIMAAVLFFAARFSRLQQPRDGWILAIWIGLAMGLHPLLRLLLLPLLIVACIFYGRRHRWLWATPVVVIVIAIALVAYVPLRVGSGHIAGLDWTHPNSVGDLWDYLTAKHIRTAHATYVMTTDKGILSEAAGRYFSDLGLTIGPVALLLCLPGLLWLARHQRVMLAVLGWTFFCDALFAIWIHPLGLPDLQNGILAAWMVAVGAGFGLLWLVQRTGRFGPFVGMLVACAALIPPWLHAMPEVMATRQLDIPRRLFERGLEQAPPRAAIFVTSDAMAATHLLLRRIEGARPDVDLEVRQQQQTRWPKKRALFWELGSDPPPGPLQLDMPWSRVGVAVPGDATRAERALGDVFSGPGGAAHSSRRYYVDALVFLGREVLARGDTDDAIKFFDAALAVDADHVDALLGRALAFSVNKDLSRALVLTERALELEPNRLQAHIAAARYRLAAGDTDRARVHLQRVLELEPNHAVARRGLTDLDKAKRK